VSFVHHSVYTNNIIRRLAQQQPQRRETNPPAIAEKSREERITEAIVGIRVIDAELTVLAAQPDADEWLIAELICQRTKRQHELDNLRRSS
jgi:hypothetical protein